MFVGRLVSGPRARWVGRGVPPCFFLTGVGRLPPPPARTGPTFHTRSAPLVTDKRAFLFSSSTESGRPTVSFPYRPVVSLFASPDSHFFLRGRPRPSRPFDAGSDEVDKLTLFLFGPVRLPALVGVFRPPSPRGREVTHLRPPYSSLKGLL